jgi:hypothetical protein
VICSEIPKLFDKANKEYYYYMINNYVERIKLEYYYSLIKEKYNEK